MYLLSELPWRLRFKCELRLPSMAIANVSHTMNTMNWIPFQRMHTARKKKVGLQKGTSYKKERFGLQKKTLLLTCGSTQTYEHNTYSPLRKSTLQQSKQEAKVSNDQTAPVCCSQPSENTDRSNSLKCTYYLNYPEDCTSSVNWGCLQWRLQMSAIRWIPWTELPFQRMHTARKKVERVYWIKITSSSQQAWRYCSQIEYKASSLHLESMYWMSLRIALDASW